MKRKQGKVDIRKENYQRQTRTLYMIKQSIYQEDRTNLDLYTPNNRVPKYVKQKLIELKGEVDKSTIIFRDFNTPSQ